MHTELSKKSLWNHFQKSNSNKGLVAHALHIHPVQIQLPATPLTVLYHTYSFKSRLAGGVG